MNYLAIAGLYAGSLILGIGYLVSTLGSIWFGTTLTGIAASMLVGGVGSGILSSMGSYVRKDTDVIAGIIFSLPTSLFALGAMGSIREEPLAFVAWIALAGTMWSSAVAGGMIAKRIIAAKRRDSMSGADKC